MKKQTMKDKMKEMRGEKMVDKPYHQTAKDKMKEKGGFKAAIKNHAAKHHNKSK